MSDLEPIQLRKLPPVEPVKVPPRMSQTLLRHEEDCPRSAYLYLKYRGGRPSRVLDRGTLGHMAFERLMLQLVATGEESYYTPAHHADEQGRVHEEGVLEARRNVASLTAAVVSEIIAENPGLVARPSEWDEVRAMAYHWALGYDVSPGSILGIEQTYVLDVTLPDGAVWEVRGKIDVSYAIGDDGAGVDDYKTHFNPQSDGDYRETFQGKLYAILLCFGQPVEQSTCFDCDGRGVLRYDAGELGEPCDVCRGRGYLERRLERQGDWINAVRTREVYPRFLRDDMTLPAAENTLTRQELQDARADLELLVQRLAGRFESWDFPAIHGSHCSMCPAKLECPLPEHLRDHAGTVNTPEEALEAAIKAAHDDDDLSARKAELRNWVAANGPIIMGDEEWVLVVSDSRSVKRRGKTTDWEGFMEAVAAAVEFGEPFDPDEWVKRRTSTNFKRRAIKPVEDNGGAG
jgi:hypothetical protein